MDLTVRKITVQANSVEANPLRSIEMTAEIGCMRTFLHEFRTASGHKDYYMDYDWEHYGTITTTDPDQIMRLDRWFRSRTPITEDQLFGNTALLGAPRG